MEPPSAGRLRRATKPSSPAQHRIKNPFLHQALLAFRTHFGTHTVSKSLAPVLRLGWILSPPALAATLARAKQITDRGSPGLDQLALAILIETGRYDRHLRRMRTEYAALRDILVQTLAQHAPAVRLTGLAAGFHAVAHLPAGTAEHTVIHEARSRSVGLYGMSTYRADHHPDPPQLVLGFGNTSQQAIRAGIAILGDILNKGP